jgi:hypothetical protein
MIDETLRRYVDIHEDEAVMLGCMHGQITSIQIQLGFFSFKVMPVLLHYLQESFVELRKNGVLNTVSVPDETASSVPQPPMKKVPGQK